MAQQWRRRVALLPLAVAVAPGLALMLVGPASADFSGGITSPTESGMVVRSHTTLTISSDVRRSLPTETGTSTLTIRVPGETSARTVAQTSSWSNNRQTLSHALNTGCVTYSASAGACTAPAPNGGYQVTLSGPRNDTRTFTLEIAPAAPTGVTARELADQRAVEVTWSANKEPDVLGYDLYSGSGELVQSGLTTTSYRLNLPESGYGGDYTFAVQAVRSAGPGTGRTLRSPLSSSATVTVNEPEPEPAPSSGDGSGSGSGGSTGGSGGSSGDPDDGGFDSGSGGGSSGGGSTGGGSSGGGSTGGSSGGGSTGGSTGGSGSDDFSSGSKTNAPTKSNPQVAQRRAFGLTFRSFAPKLGQPKLPPLPKFAEPVEPDGTYEETLDFGEQEVAFPETVTRPGGVRGVIDTVYSTVFEGRRLWTSLAWGFLLILGAGHVRVFLGSPAQD